MHKLIIYHKLFTLAIDAKEEITLKINHVRNPLTQSAGKLLHVGEGNILFSPLYHTYIGSMHLGKLAKTLLGYALLYTFVAHPLAKLLEYFLIHTYIPSVGIANYRLYIL